jgi:ABC-2 type transport system ATP-binding protein
VGVRSLTSQPPTLEELFLRHYGDEIADVARKDESVEAAGR